MEYSANPHSSKSIFYANPHSNIFISYLNPRKSINNCEFEMCFDITNWRFYMAFDGDTPVGAATVAGTTESLYMLGGRDDACVLWDIRVADAYKHQGIGQSLFDMAKTGAGNDGYKQMIIECQNNNVTACRFYKKQGALLGKVDAYAYYNEPDVRDEVQFLWYLDLLIYLATTLARKTDYYLN